MTISVDSAVAVLAVTSAGESTHVVGTDVKSVRIKNLGPNPAYMAMVTGVTDANGYTIVENVLVGGEIFDVVEGMTLYFRCAAAETADVRIIEEY